jgi:hypothetical protein
MHRNNMSQVSKRVLNPEIQRQIHKSLIFVVKNLKKDEDINNLLLTVFSENERTMISKRIATAFLIHNHVNPSEICEVLKITPETVNRLKLKIKADSKSFDNLFVSMDKLKSNDNIKKILSPILKSAISAAGGKIPMPKFYATKPQYKKPSIF